MLRCPDCPDSVSVSNTAASSTCHTDNIADALSDAKPHS
jgi:hypothetical protein